jgi:hypothetical protein
MMRISRPTGINQVNKSDQIVGKLSNPGPLFLRNMDDSTAQHMYQRTASMTKRIGFLRVIVASALCVQTYHLSRQDIQGRLPKGLNDWVKNESTRANDLLPKS